MSKDMPKKGSLSVDIVEMFQDGGPFVYVVLLGFLTAGLPGLLLWGLGFTQRRVPTALYALWPTGIVVVGAIGSIWGVEQAKTAMAYSSEEYMITLGAMGLFVAGHPTTVGGLAAAVVLAFSAFVAGIPRVVRAGSSTRFTPLHALPVAGITLINGATIGMFLGWMAAAITVLSGLGIAIASLRIGTSAADAKRGASVRLGIAALGVLAGVLLSWSMHILLRGLRFHGGLFAGIEGLNLFENMLAADLNLNVWSGLWAAGATAVVGVLSALPVMRDIATARSLLHGLLFAVVALVLAGTMGAVEVVFSQFAEVLTLL